MGADNMWACVIRRIRIVEQRWALGKRALLRWPPLALIGDRRNATRRRVFAVNLPTVPPEHLAVLTELRAFGVSTRTITMPKSVLKAADSMLEGLSSQVGLSCTVHVPPGELALDPTVFKWGLTDENLDLAEQYISLPVRYLGVDIKREGLGDRRREAIRDWHIDVEDRQMLKVIIYLSDVDDRSAPLEYLDSDSTQRIIASGPCFRCILSGPLTFESISSQEEIHRIVGPRLTAIYADTSRIAHRVKTPLSAERMSVTFVYASDKAYYAYPHFMLPRKTLQQLRHTLNPRQLRALGMN